LKTLHHVIQCLLRYCMSKKLPALKSKKVITVLERSGFYVHHVSGSHYILKKDNLRVTIPYHNRDLKPGTLKSIIEQAGMTVEEFLELL
jgi:predicted RNA binding protein YcfA (HicA-like mRNA interferase family)